MPKRLIIALAAVGMAFGVAAPANADLDPPRSAVVADWFSYNFTVVTFAGQAAELVRSGGSSTIEVSCQVTSVYTDMGAWCFLVDDRGNRYDVPPVTASRVSGGATAVTVPTVRDYKLCVYAVYGPNQMLSTSCSWMRHVPV